MLCSKCGNQNKGTAKFCGVCGNKLNQDVSSVPKYSPPVQNKNYSANQNYSVKENYSAAKAPSLGKNENYSAAKAPSLGKNENYSTAKAPSLGKNENYSAAKAPSLPEKKPDRQKKKIHSPLSGTVKSGNYVINYAGTGDTGDNMLIMPSSTSMFIIADGTGIAPSIAIKTVGSDAGVLSDVSLLARAMRKANEKIYRYGQKEGNISGCKFTALLLKENSLTVAHVGDIRVYIINKNKIRQITDDHTPLGKMLKNRKITPKEAGISLRKNIAYRMVGTNPQLEIALYQQKLTGGDTVLMCTRGVWMYVSDEEILKTVNRDIKSINGRLADMAEQRGCKII